MFCKIIACDEFDDIIEEIEKEEKRSEGFQKQIWRYLLSSRIIEIK